MPKKLELSDRIERFINKCKNFDIIIDDNIECEIKKAFTLYFDSRIIFKPSIDEILFDILYFDKNRLQNNFYERILKLKEKRGVTLNKLKLRYGEEEGIKRWEEYRKKQSINGSSKEWFIQKLGEEEGIKRWNKINFLKSNSVPSLVERLGISEEEAEKIVENNFIKNIRKNFYSKISQKLFWQLYEKIKDNYKNIFFAELNHEFGKYSKELSRYCLYDFVIEDIKFCIEFQGDNYHGNPKFYKPNDKLKARGVTNIIVKNVWEEDLKKKNTLLNNGYDLIYVWESDYVENEERVIELCLKRIEKLKKHQILALDH